LSLVSGTPFETARVGLN